MGKTLLLIAVCTLLVFTSADYPQARIIGGHKVSAIKHPYLVSIRRRVQKHSSYVHKCAGVIYNERAILTAAQCVADIKDTEKVMIIAGGNSRTGLDGMLFPALKWVSHPKYSSWTVDYDIGIMIAEHNFDFANSKVNSISIKTSRPKNGKMGTVVGWGYREEFGPSSSYLEEVEVPIVSFEDCTTSYGVGEITDRMICAGYLKAGGKDSCQGDAGGPLLVDKQLVGLVSWGRGCGRPGYPTVYTFVGALRQWINETIASFD